MDSIKKLTMDFFEKSAENELEIRLGQVEMAKDVCTAIEAQRPLAVEAEVGTGKSYAYLIPAVIKFCREHRQIIIATSTIALQEQLYADALHVMKMLGINVEIVLAKGIKNYVCKRRLKKLSNKKHENKMVNRLCAAVENGNYDYRDIKVSISPELWEKVNVSKFGSDYCKMCDFSTSCAYCIIRNKIRREHNIVICNQNMLVSHLINEKQEKGIFNKNCSMIIVDEAHNIEEKFRSAFTESYNRIEFIHEINKFIDTAQKTEQKLALSLVKSMGKTINELFEIFAQQIQQQKKEADDEMETFFCNYTKEVKKCTYELCYKLERFEKFIHVPVTEILNFTKRIKDIAENDIIWLEDGKYIRLCVCRSDIRSDISQLLFRNKSVILTSATISNRQSGNPQEQCKYYLDSIGFPIYGKVSEPKKSPFDYDKNAILYISGKMPYPKHDRKEEYRMSSIPEILALLEITNGKALILFTSKTDMEYVYKKLSNMHLSYKIYLQTNGSSQAYVLEKFRKDVNSVILGTGTYWEGINIEGLSLSQVIIYKLPFPVPEPIISYKMSLTENPLKDVAVPEMIIKLRQGIGRLIRSASDRGIISILDPRINSEFKADYRRDVLSSPPMKNVTESIEEIQKFWNKTTEEKP